MTMPGPVDVRLNLSNEDTPFAVTLTDKDNKQLTADLSYAELDQLGFNVSNALYGHGPVETPHVLVLHNEYAVFVSLPGGEQRLTVQYSPARSVVMNGDSFSRDVAVLLLKETITELENIEYNKD